jgi:hypothetical protein
MAARTGWRPPKKPDYPDLSAAVPEHTTARFRGVIGAQAGIHFYR